MEHKNVEKLTDKLGMVFKDYDKILCVILFGSYNTEYYNRNSDLDFAIVYDGYVDIQYELELEIRISEILGTDNIDVINLNKKPLSFKHKVLSTGRIIYENDYEKTSDFLEEVFRGYCDQEYDIREMNQQFDYSLKESYINGRY